jgi:nucleotidyltransferase substrate binding protein (TIGR01987 family)
VNTQIILRASKEKLAAALEILFASVDAYVPFDAARRYTPKEREPYDALTDRYLRAFESSLKFFRTLERYREAAPSESFRDLLQRMEKYGVITGAALWIEMRDTRNRIAHEYLPEELAKIYADIVGPEATELRHVLRQSAAHL